MNTSQETPATHERSSRVDLVIIIGWILILIKSLVVAWACTRYAIPIHPLWIIAPTVIFGLLCTGIYLQRR